MDSGKRALEILDSVYTHIDLPLFLLDVLDHFLRIEPSFVDILQTSFWIQEPNVSMIITDYWMPEMTGYNLLKKVKVYIVQY